MTVMSPEVSNLYFFLHLTWLFSGLHAFCKNAFLFNLSKKLFSFVAVIWCRKDKPFPLEILAAEAAWVFWGCIAGGEIMHTCPSFFQSTWEHPRMNPSISKHLYSHPPHKTWVNYLFSDPFSSLPCWQTCQETRILNTGLFQHQDMPGGSPLRVLAEDRADEPVPYQQPRR